ncbi:hypothetical protein EDB85DRAFT_1148737 [Lactarius pseudohatsudake]|nr:hypothetical protein EDB85DRAFT_1148737 [Lactarius pseudohatsudake]
MTVRIVQILNLTFVVIRMPLVSCLETTSMCQVYRIKTSEAPNLERSERVQRFVSHTRIKPYFCFGSALSSLWVWFWTNERGIQIGAALDWCV